MPDDGLVDNPTCNLVLFLSDRCNRRPVVNYVYWYPSASCIWRIIFLIKWNASLQLRESGVNTTSQLVARAVVLHEGLSIGIEALHHQLFLSPKGIGLDYRCRWISSSPIGWITGDVVGVTWIQHTLFVEIDVPKDVASSQHKVIIASLDADDRGDGAHTCPFHKILISFLPTTATWMNALVLFPGLTRPGAAILIPISEFDLKIVY